MNWQWLDMAIGFYMGLTVGIIATIGAMYVGVLFKKGEADDLDQRQR